MTFKKVEMKTLKKPKKYLTKKVVLPNIELKELTQKELLTLTRVLINVRDGRDISFSIPSSTPKVIACAKKIEKMPKEKQQKEIAKINRLAFENI